MAGIGAAIGKTVLDTAAASDALVEMSIRPGLSVEKLQELSYIGKQVGAGYRDSHWQPGKDDPKYEFCQGRYRSGRGCFCITGDVGNRFKRRIKDQPGSIC